MNIMQDQISIPAGIGASSEPAPMVFQAPYTNCDTNLFWNRVHRRSVFISTSTLLFFSIMAITMWSNYASQIYNLIKFGVQNTDFATVLWQLFFLFICIVITYCVFAEARLIGTVWVKLRRPLDHPVADAISGLNFGPREIILHHDRIEMRFEHVTEVHWLAGMRAVKRCRNMLMLYMANDRCHLITPDLGADEITALQNRLAQAIRKARRARRGEGTKLDANNPQVTFMKGRAVDAAWRAWLKSKGLKPWSVAWPVATSVILAWLVVPALTDLVTGLSTGSFSWSEQTTLGLLALPAFVVSVRLILKVIAGKIGLRAPLDRAQRDADMGLTRIEICDDRIIATRRLQRIELSSRAPFEVFETGDMFVIGAGIAVLDVLPARADLRDALIRFGHLPKIGPWGVSPTKIKEPAPC